jgi:hypothetical protein
VSETRTTMRRANILSKILIYGEPQKILIEHRLVEKDLENMLIEPGPPSAPNVSAE